MKQIQKGNTALITVIIVVLTITIGVIVWIFTKNLQAPTQNVATQPTTPAPIAQTQPNTPTQPATQSQTNDETASWQTFANTKLGFSIKYPTGYVAKNGDETKSFDPSFYISNPQKKEVQGVSHNYALELDYNANFIGGTDGRAKNPTEWLDFQRESGDTYANTTLGGQTAYVKDSKYNGIDTKEYIIFLNKGSMYDMYQFIVRKDDIGDKLLSTLTLVK